MTVFSVANSISKRQYLQHVTEALAFHTRENLIPGNGNFILESFKSLECLEAIILSACSA